MTNTPHYRKSSNWIIRDVGQDTRGWWSSGEGVEVGSVDKQREKGNERETERERGGEERERERERE